jgi:hypothetical protein
MQNRMAQTFTKEQFWDDLEKIGEEGVRANLVTKVYGDLGAKHDLAEAWLESKERSRIAASSAEQHRIARSAKNAAWIAAIAAIVAAIAAAIAAVIAYFSLK